MADREKKGLRKIFSLRHSKSQAMRPMNTPPPDYQFANSALAKEWQALNPSSSTVNSNSTGYTYTNPNPSNFTNLSSIPEGPPQHNNNNVPPPPQPYQVSQPFPFQQHQQHQQNQQNQAHMPYPPPQHLQPGPVPPSTYNKLQRPAPTPAPPYNLHSPNGSNTSFGSKSTSTGGFRSFSAGSHKSNASNGSTATGSDFPGTGTNSSAPGAETSVSAMDVRRCTKLLRRLFELRLEMWALENTHESDAHVRLERQKTAELVLVDIRNTVAQWRATRPDTWSQEEYAEVDWIVRTLPELQSTW
jgi:hypothetical protein